MTSRCCSTPARACFSERCARPSGASFRWRRSLHLVLARRGGRMRIAQSVPRRRAASRATLRPDRGDGVDRRPGRPPAAGARRRGAPRARTPHACNGSTRRICRMDGSADSSSSPRRARCSVATCSPSSASDTPRSPRTTSSSPARRRGSAWTTTRTRRTPAAALAPRRNQPTTLACMHGSAWRGDGAALLRNLASRLAPPSH